MLVVLDSNVLVSFALRSRALKPLQDAWRAERFSSLVSPYLLAEVEDVLGRAKFVPYLSAEDRAQFVRDLLAFSEVVRPRQPFPEFEDPKDRYLLAMLRDSDAEGLVTGDKALLALGDFEGKPTISPSDFLAHLTG